MEQLAEEETTPENAGGFAPECLDLPPLVLEALTKTPHSCWRSEKRLCGGYGGDLMIDPSAAIGRRSQPTHRTYARKRISRAMELAQRQSLSLMSGYGSARDPEQRCLASYTAVKKGTAFPQIAHRKGAMS